MKKILLFTLITIAFCGNTYSQTADKITVLDTRDVNDGPDQFDNEVVFEFKRRSTLGIPGAGTFSGMLTFAPWRDNSGDAHHQLNFNEGGIFYRTGQPAETSWDGWNKILFTDENGNFNTTYLEFPKYVTKENATMNTKAVIGWSQSGILGIAGSLFLAPRTDLPNAGIGFWTANQNDLNAEPINRMYIHANGNVGIGTTNPTQKLHVLGNSKFENGSAYSTTLYGHVIGFSRNSANYIWAESEGGYLLFGVNGDSKGVAYSAMQIDAAKNTRFYGNVAIGTTTIPSGCKLAVDGKIICEEVKVEMSDQWADFVFESNYNLMPLKELDTYIQENKRLPEIPTTTEVQENGISVGEMNAKLLQKIEELTLYLLAQQKEIENLKVEVQEFKK